MTARDEAARLVDEIGRLRAVVAEGGQRRMEAWQPLLRRAEFTASAANLAAYLALRRVDMTALQPRLTALGLSSLGRAEAHVAASLASTLAALRCIAGGDAEGFAPPADFAAGAALIAARRDALFGPGDGTCHTRIMVTLPAAAAGDGNVVGAMVEAGADCLRINCAHDDAEAWRGMLRHAADAAARRGRPVPVEMDLGGPKLRIASVEAAPGARLAGGDRFTLARRPGAGPRPRLVLEEPRLFDALADGAQVWIDDGKLRAVVRDIAGDHAVCEATLAPAKGWKPKAEKGVNLIGAPLDLPALTGDDLATLPFVASHADMVALSFVQHTADVTDLLDRIEALAPPRMPGVVLKIETPLALRNLPDLIVAAGGRAPVAVMIARGDLAVEIGFERLSEIQEQILWICEAAHVPVIWATQVLEGLVKDGTASRAEMTDAAMSQRAECVMLNKGAHVTEGIAFLRDILPRMSRHTAKRADRMTRLGLWP